MTDLPLFSREKEKGTKIKEREREETEKKRGGKKKEGEKHEIATIILV